MSEPRLGRSPGCRGPNRHKYCHELQSQRELDKQTISHAGKILSEVEKAMINKVNGNLGYEEALTSQSQAMRKGRENVVSSGKLFFSHM